MPSTYRLASLAGLVAAGALMLPAAASAHPGWYFVTAKIAKTPEIQTLTRTGSGDWQPSTNADVVSDTATAADVQAALDADHALVPGSPATPGYDNVRVTGPNGGPYTVTFIGTLAGVNVPLLTGVGATWSASQDGGASVTYTGDPAADQARMADQVQAVIANDGYTFGYRETNGVGPVADGPTYAGGGAARAFTGAGMLNLSKILPGSYRAGMTELQKMEYPPGQTGIQVHATCGGVPALEDPNAIAQVWDRASDHDPFYNYIPWQKTSAGLGDEPSQWIPVVKAATAGLAGAPADGVDLSTLATVQQFTDACTALGGSYHPADTQSLTASAAISDAVNAATAPLNSQVSALTARVGSLVPQLAAMTSANTQLSNENAALKAGAPSARTPALTLASRRISLQGATAMVTGPTGQTATVKVQLSAAAAKALHLKSRTVASKRKSLGDRGAALVVLPLSKAATKALKKAKGSLPATVTATAGTATTSTAAKLKS